MILVPPKLTKIPDRSYTIYEGDTAKLTCEAFGFPTPVIQWTRPFSALQKGRNNVNNGTLSIQDFRPEDTGTYMCTATNNLGSTRTLTALGVRILESGILYFQGSLGFCLFLSRVGKRNPKVIVVSCFELTSQYPTHILNLCRCIIIEV